MRDELASGATATVEPNGPLPEDATTADRPTFETAAAQCTAQVPVVEPTERAGDVRDRLVGRQYDSASHVVVCCAGRFLGVVTIEDLLCAPPAAVVETLMDRDAPVVAPGVDQEIAAWRAVRHGESALAVVDERARFVGLIPPHRLVAVLLAEHEEDLSRLGGFLRTSSVARTRSEEPVGHRFWHRLPWLLLGLCGTFLAADLVGAFEEHLRLNVAVAFFMPGIVYLADSVGTQTEIVIVRGLSLGVPMARMVGRELLAVLAIGLTLGAIAAPLVWWHWADPSLALSVGLSIFAASTTATVVGLVLPWIFDRLSIDPAVGSGPLATVFQDLFSIWVYLTVTVMLMRLGSSGAVPPH
jgi:magnesium transporter